jgi:hypothetical protein
MSFLGVMLGLPYLHSIWHPQSTVCAIPQADFFMSVSKLVANYCCISPFLAFIVIKMSLKTNNLPIF